MHGYLEPFFDNECNCWGSRRTSEWTAIRTRWSACRCCTDSVLGLLRGVVITTAEGWKSFLTRRRELIKEQLCQKIRVSGNSLQALSFPIPLRFLGPFDPTATRPPLTALEELCCWQHYTRWRELLLCARSPYLETRRNCFRTTTGFYGWNSPQILLFSGGAFDCMLGLPLTRKCSNEPTAGTSSDDAPLFPNQMGSLGCLQELRRY